MAKNKHTKEQKKSNANIAFFIKFFEKKEYAADFIKGKIYANKLSYFKKAESDTNVKMDKNEGVSAIFQPNKSTIKINDMVIDTVAPTTLSFEKDEYKNIFCVYALMMPLDGAYKDIEDFKNKLMISPKCEELGKYAVIVSANEFIKKIKAVKLKQFKINKIQMGKINYYDENEFDGSFDDDKSLFNKTKKFEYQKEYRLVICSDVEEELILEIGSFEGITKFCKTKNINKGLQLTVDGNNILNRIKYKIKDIKR